MVRIGIVGIGFMGMIHYYAARKVRGAKVSAIATRNPKKLKGDWRSIQGNFGPRGGKEDLSGVRSYANVDELIADPDVDLVDVCLPTDMHRDVTVAALRAGKHVLVEKSIALDLADANAMVRAAEKAGKLLMVAHVLPFFPEFAFAREAIESGRYGKLLGGHFKRMISTPDWSEEIADLAKTGGPGIDLHIHDTHFIRLVCGMPKAVYSRGRLENGYMQYVTTQYLYDDPELTVTCSSGGITQAGRPFAHGFEIYLERATLLYEFATLGHRPNLMMPLSVLTADGKVRAPKFRSAGTSASKRPEDDPSITAFTAEIRCAVDAVNSGVEPPLLSGALARDALRLCHKEAQSVRTARPVKVG